MEFNTINKSAEVSNKETSAQTTAEKVVLKSTERATVGSIPNNLKVDVKNKPDDINSVVVTHDAKEVLNTFDRNKHYRN